MNSPFNNLSTSQINKLFDLLGVHIYKYDKNTEILSTLKNNNILCVVMSGYAQIVYIEYNGNEIVVENLQKDGVFGTNMSGTNNENCEIIAKEDTEILVIDYRKLVNPQNTNHNFYNIFLLNLFDIINLKSKERNERIRVLEKKQIRDKLLEFFEIERKKSSSNTIVLSLSLKDLADYIAVNRSAMFRELKHLKDDNLIKINGKRIVLMY